MLGPMFRDKTSNLPYLQIQHTNFMCLTVQLDVKAQFLCLPTEEQVSISCKMFGKDSFPVVCTACGLSRRFSSSTSAESSLSRLVLEGDSAATLLRVTQESELLQPKKARECTQQNTGFKIPCKTKKTIAYLYTTNTPHQ